MPAYQQGFCSRCGTYDPELTPIYDGTLLCNECLENGDYIQCDSCGKYYPWNALRFFHLSNGKTLCENCFTDLAINEDEISRIEDHTSYAEFDYVNLTDGRNS